MRSFSHNALIFTFILAFCSDRAQAENWAILIGVNDYNQAPKLKFCGADQEALRDHLIKGGFDSNRIVVLTSDAKNKNLLPTHDNIKTQLDLTLNLLQEGDIVVFGFSGHGVQVDSKDYLCPSDTDLSKEDTLISLNSVYDSLQKSKASMKLMLVDACKNEVSFTKNANVRALGNDKNNIPKGIFMMSSCSPGEMSFEDKTFGHGVWMHFVLEGMRGKADKDNDNKVSLSEIADYTYLNTGLHVKDKFVGKQKPWAKYDGEFATLQFNVAEIEGYKSKLASTEEDANKMANSDSAGSTPPKRTLSEKFETEYKGAMNAASIDERISLFTLMIASPEFTKAEKDVVRSTRMKLYGLRGKPGDLENAIKDSKEIGNSGIPVIVESGDLTLLDNSKSGNNAKHAVKKGEVLNITQMKQGFLWVSAVNGEEKRKGWVDKDKILRGGGSSEQVKVASNQQIEQVGGSAKGYYVDESEFIGDDIQFAKEYLKDYDDQLRSLQKEVDRPFNGMSFAERQLYKKAIEQEQRESKLYQQELRKLENQQKLQNIFNGGGQKNGFGGGGFGGGGFGGGGFGGGGFGGGGFGGFGGGGDDY